MIIKPTADLTLELYVDADFARLWNAENSEEPISVKSCTGFIIMIG